MQVKRLAAAALESAESDRIRCESLTHLARAHHATDELEAAFKYYRQVRPPADSPHSGCCVFDVPSIITAR